MEHEIRRKIYKDGIGLNDDVTVQIPAGIIIAAVSAYAEAEWCSGAVSQLMVMCQEQIIDPLYWNETQAAHQEAHDQAEAMRNQMMQQIMPHIMPHDPRIEPE